jgi:prenyltransferase beta subunit
MTQLRVQKDAKDWQVVASDSFRMSGVYWAATALALMDTPVAAFRNENALVEWILSCYKPSKGCFAPNTHHDGNLLATLSAVQLMALMGRIQELNAEKIASCAPRKLVPLQPAYDPRRQSGVNAVHDRFNVHPSQGTRTY